MSFSSAIIFAVRELLIAEFSQLSFEGLYYMGYGPVPLCILYFTLRKEWKKVNYPGDKYNQRAEKVLFRTWDNKFDWTSLWVCCFTAIM